MNTSATNSDMWHLFHGDVYILEALNGIYDMFTVGQWEGVDPVWVHGVPSLARAIAAAYFDEVFVAMQADERQWATHVASYLTKEGIVAGALYVSKHADEFNEHSVDHLIATSCDRATSDAVVYAARFIGAPKMLRSLAQMLVEEFSEALPQAQTFDDDVFRSIMPRVRMVPSL